MQNNVTSDSSASMENGVLRLQTKGLFRRDYRIEMQKLLKRWDVLLLLLGLVIPLALSISLAAHASFWQISAAQKIDAVHFLVMVTRITSSVCIFHLIIALYVARFYCSEVENNSVLLYVPRIRSRSVQYSAKFSALLTVVTAAQIFIDLVSLLCFYGILVPARPDIATGQGCSGAQWGAAAATLLAYLFSYLVGVSVIMGRGSYLKMVPSFAVCAGFVFACQLLPNAPAESVQMLSPWRYINGLGNYVYGQTDKLTQPELLAGCVICFVTYLLILSTVGLIKFKKRDLG